jgi:sarcosine oxidase subunit alpha
VEGEMSQVGTRLAFYEDECNGELIYGTVVETPFYDPSGQRMKM